MEDTVPDNTNAAPTGRPDFASSKRRKGGLSRQVRLGPLDTIEQRAAATKRIAKALAAGRIGVEKAMILGRLVKQAGVADKAPIEVASPKGPTQLISLVLGGSAPQANRPGSAS
jgi:hypothetical protein